MFTRNPNQWQAPKLAATVVEAFRAARSDSGVRITVSHAGYLINLAARERAVRDRSRRALRDELERARRLGLDAVVVHPGAHVGAGEARGLARAARSLDAVLRDRPAGDPPLLLENTAGQGTLLGHRIEQLAAIIDLSHHPARLGLCVDTCHAFAAGYALHEVHSYEAFWEEIDRLIGLSRLGCVHLNDSLRPFASRRDRHANLGHGRIGLETFRRLLRDPRLDGLPLILETPWGDRGAGHRSDLGVLRDLGAGAGNPVS
jgi:deoxyribonuclease-4